MSKELIWILVVGAILMNIMIIQQMKWYGVARWKSVIITITLVLVGWYGSQLWYFIENGSFGGLSFYGSIFFAPIVFLFVAAVFHISYLHSLAFCAPAGCLMLALIKVDCLITGCCDGIPLYTTSSGAIIRFPSQITEMINFLVLGAVLFFLSKKEKYRRKIFPIFLVLYGSTRFVLNLFREEILLTKQILPIGNVWSAIAVVVGVLWLMLLRNKELDEVLARLQSDNEIVELSDSPEEQ